MNTAVESRRAYTKREGEGTARRTPGVRPAGAAPRISLAAMSRRHCPECGPETLFAGTVCCGCGRDSAPGNRRAKRPQWNGAVTRRGVQLRTPIGEDAGNLLSLMAAKR